MPVDQWLPIAGFLITWTTGVIGLVKAVQSIKTDVSEKIAAEVLARTTALSDAVVKRNEEMEALRRDFLDAQRIQDNHVGEMGAALRRFIESVEKEMHAIEIWNRDNFVQKGEFERATDSIKADIKAMASDIKADIKDLKAELGGKIN
jgi:hypothetical protein